MVAVRKARYSDALKRWHDGWPKFWQRFGVTLGDGDLVLPAYRRGYDWSIVMPRGLTNTRAYEICQELFTCWKYWDDLEVLKPANAVAKAVDRSRCLLVRSGAEGDEALADCSAKMIWRAKTPVLTLKPHLVLHARYYLQTARRRDENNRHLDVGGWTLCPGSRRSGGLVPSPSWDPGYRRLCVYWTRPGNRSDGLRSREAVFA